MFIMEKIRKYKEIQKKSPINHQEIKNIGIYTSGLSIHTTHMCYWKPRVTIISKASFTRGIIVNKVNTMGMRLQAFSLHPHHTTVAGISSIFIEKETGDLEIWLLL